MKILINFIKNIIPNILFCVGFIFSIIGTLLLKSSGKLHILFRTKTGTILVKKMQDEKKTLDDIQSIIQKLTDKLPKSEKEDNYFATSYKGPTGQA